VDKQGNVYVTGVSYDGSHSLEDYTTIKYVQTPSDVRDEIGNGVNTSGFILSCNYPNPFNPTTKIKYSISAVGTSFMKFMVVLKVYDILGNEIATLVNEEKPAGTYELTWSATGGLPSGVYFYQLRAGSYVETKKMILLK
jgi:hypothetical protein